MMNPSKIILIHLYPSVYSLHSSIFSLINVKSHKNINSDRSSHPSAPGVWPPTNSGDDRRLPR